MVIRAVVALVGMGAMAGCVPVPLSMSEAPVDVPLPDVRPHVPLDVQQSSSEILVLTQAARRHHASLGNRARSGGTFLSADFIKGTELESLKDRFQLRSSRRLLVVTVFLTGHEDYYTDSLNQLCLITTDGRMFALTPNDRTWASSRHERLDSSKLPAFLNGIRRPSKGINWLWDPCGGSGDVTWSASLRSRVEEFLARIPNLR